jgi:hypothetical protein
VCVCGFLLWRERKEGGSDGVGRPWRVDGVCELW